MMLIQLVFVEDRGGQVPPLFAYVTKISKGKEG